MKKFFKNIYRFLSPKWQTIHLDYPISFRPRYTLELGNPHSLLQEIITKKKESYGNLLNLSLKYKRYLLEIPINSQGSASAEASWINPYFPGLDTLVLYSLVAELIPSKFIEVGSGHSTLVVKKAINDFKLATKTISIDPAPRINIEYAVDKHLATSFEEADLTEIWALEKGDILFIDNSHRILPNSDATRFFMEVLPKLKKGVYVHLHDIYLPFDYPQFMCDRYYSEQYVLAAFILANPDKYVTLMPNYWVSQQGDLAAILDPIWNQLPQVEKHGGSYWLLIN